ncbi:MAG: D-alanyl-D-alanine carboxypeptidase/D-alanyl-D-alanine-endopeptidase [Calditrichaeota bacterium]|nr:D-alanyl-D-alanine carboxypeptidase/D-alanyl-D-alanine-endopeptidase [Calditrichota bacterium]
MARFILILSFVLLMGTLLQGQTQIGKIISLINEQQKSELLKNAQWSLYAFYPNTERTIIDVNSQFALAPASGLKLITTGAALVNLGEEFRFKTKIYYSGNLTSDGTLRGNLYIVGGGDPTLGSDIVKGSLPLDSLTEVWFSAIKHAGIKGVKGRIFADDLLFSGRPIPDNWFWVDIGNYYGASSPALSVHDNLYYLDFIPSRTVGKPAQIAGTRPLIPNLTFNNYMLTAAAGSGDNGYIYCAPGQWNAEVYGTVPAGVDTFTIKGAIPDPALFTAQYLTRYLNRHGINVSLPAERLKKRPDYSTMQLLIEQVSPPLKDIVFQINKRSINLYCELLTKMLSVENGGSGKTTEGLKVIRKTLTNLGVSTDGLYLSDGSGLARTNTITARLMAEFLSKMSKQSCFPSFYASLAVAGDPDDTGHFSSWGKGTPLAFNGRIKSGFIEGVRSHSGYLKDRSGDLIVFSFIANNFNGKIKKIDKIHEKLLIMLAKLP